MWMCVLKKLSLPCKAKVPGVNIEKALSPLITDNVTHTPSRTHTHTNPQTHTHTHTHASTRTLHFY